MNMKNLFPEYFVDKDKINKIWDDCLFVFDANFLCDLYRYSDVTRLNFIEVINKFSERVWLPHRAVEEYLRNRRGVIRKQEELYVEVVSKLNDLEGNLNHKKQHPFVNKELHSKFFSVSEQLKRELEESRAEYVKRINDEDDIKDEIINIFDGKIGCGFDEEKLKEIFKEGESRYKEKIPPGYMDKVKDEVKDKNEHQCLTENDKKSRVYGDLLIWKQIIEKSKQDNKNVIFITNDSKEDWWKLEGPNTLGPRGELIKEFEKETSCFFYMYGPDRFLKFAQEYLDVKVNKEALEEIQEIKEEDEKKNLKNTVMARDLRGFVDSNNNSIFENDFSFKENLNIEDRLEVLLSEIDRLNDKRHQFLYRLKMLDINSEEGSGMAKELMIRIKLIEKHRDAIMTKVRLLENKVYKNSYNDLNDDFLQ